MRIQTLVGNAEEAMIRVDYVGFSRRGQCRLAGGTAKEKGRTMPAF